MKQTLLSFFVGSMILTSVAFAQDKKVSGRVTGADGKPLVGVTIAVQGSNVATQTDANGNYSFSVPTGKVIVFRSVGYSDKTLIVKEGQSAFNVTLDNADNSLQEVVVTALGIQRSAKSLTYATSQVKPDELVQNSEPDLLKNLQGKVAGVDIRTSQGTPGAATRFQMRGNNSFSGNTQPLIIVDGVPYENEMTETSSMTSGGGAYSSGIANLDPNDIASMNILKGSAASALYGSRASSGVVIITTKSGSAKLDRPTAITLKSSVSMEKLANLPDYQNLYGAGSQFNYSNSNGSWGPGFANLDSIPTWPAYLDAYPDLFGSKVPYRAYPNNVKDLFQTGIVWENSVNIAGGSEKTGFNLTLSQMDHKGYVPNSFFKRYNIGAGGILKLSDKFSARGNVSLSNSNQRGGFFGENQVDGAASAFARSLFLARNWDMSLPSATKTGDNLNWLGGSQFDHPTWSNYNNIANTSENRVLASFGLNYDINDWWKLDYSLGANLSFMNRNEIYEISSRAYEGLGGLVVDSRNHRELESTFRTIFTPKINDDFSFTGFVGFNYNQRITDRNTDEGKRFITKGIHSLTNTAQQAFITDNLIKRRIMGIFAEGTFGFRDYWFLTLTGRNDFSSTLPKDSRSYFYPAISSAFILTDALKVKSDILSYAKLRAAYGKVGKDTDPYNLVNTYIIDKNFLGLPSGYINQTSFDPNLKPEFTKEVEFGTEIGLFSNKIHLDFTWYNRISTNLLSPISVPTSSGYDEYFTNFGKISNKGIEVALEVKPLSSYSPVKWSVSFAFTKNKNMVEELIEGTDRMPQRGILSGSISTYLEPGQPYGYLRGTKVLRDDAGNLLINPLTGGMILDQSNEYNVGNPNPDFKLGINNVISYKGFTFAALFDWTKGGDMYSVTNSSLLGRGASKLTENREYNAILPGVYGDPNTGKPILDDGGNKIWNQTKLTVNDLYFSPNATVGQTFAINTATEWNIYDATVYRLREMSIGYEVPSNVFTGKFIKGINISLTGRNLWHFAPGFPKYSNFDPEVNSFGSSAVQGIDLSAAPTTRRYGFNLIARF
ncbi:MULTISPECIES: SusC/RagA family TonB-linked outer membrane protein [unclassified Sphingobacterium]|uniref:SusC/RagA family TonB-linked outer membrane protein n=1 Tax=unclassified Sphingobacterium TaxID=2609468 RepID=UPI0010432BD0|nr:MULTISPECIES: SusC/RagA family TonB-linked outer membrane protein [unclassified Sphingobacterium]MCS3555944.1 TonB-linked SusC/RagA family outer membrane protein [Sphingobacterium sp. JUb21]TCR00224.1 TonB-linked SusC/RagA family outer membrane protein [Sphingobacterium sp. JUb20]